MPYLAPASFEPVRGWVSLEAAFAEQFFLPEAKFDQSDFQVTGPDGMVRAPKEQVAVKSRTVLDDELKTDGTYKYSTGQRFGAVFHSYVLNGKTENSREPDFVLPKGATLKAHFQSVTRAETYISKGKPDQKALNASGKGLELQFISHPNDLYAGQPVNGLLLLDGKPLANSTLELHRAASAQASQDKTAPLQINSNARGEFTLTPPQAGTYLLLARHRAAAPPGAKAPLYSYTSTAVFEAAE
ncbi:hypothetical protein ATY27_08295 [Rheinheimera sp. F8]|nr:hypothetical protein ATY27_08295 [Rheinheimera sp. F8]